ncbi:cyanophycinase [Parapedobacter deserti]|uniref:Cyanophycinase n=1 Tax=Parapedobacter deserti TaxID=1912957 RepID=A0ABV7JP68_9SPHI
MDKTLGLAGLSLLLACMCCKGAAEAGPSPSRGSHAPDLRPASLGIVGDTADVQTVTRGGLVLMGGGRDVDAAFQWMIARAGGGDAVIIRASGTDAYNPYVSALGTLNSVETLKIDSRALANDERVAQAIRNAELLFIAGGDQSNYVAYWKGTKVQEAINFLLNEKKVPVGGTSAGCAILGSSYFTGAQGSVTSDEALSNPMGGRVAIGHDDFLHAPFLSRLITDQHYLARSRQGRSMVFLSALQAAGAGEARAIAVDERTAVCIDEAGLAQVVGESSAFFLRAAPDKPPEVYTAGEPLEWNHGQQAVAVYEIAGSLQGAGAFNVSDFRHGQPQGGLWQWWWVENGKLYQKQQQP